MSENKLKLNLNSDHVSISGMQFTHRNNFAFLFSDFSLVLLLFIAISIGLKSYSVSLNERDAWIEEDPANRKRVSRCCCCYWFSHYSSQNDLLQRFLLSGKRIRTWPSTIRTEQSTEFHSIHGSQHFPVIRIESDCANNCDSYAACRMEINTLHVKAHSWFLLWCKSMDLRNACPVWRCGRQHITIVVA